MATYANADDVRLALGPLGNRLGPDVDVDAHLAMAHAEVLDKLADAYPGELPTFEGAGLDTLRWAEARLAAAAILDVLHAATNTDSAVAATLRTTAYDTLTRGVPGYRPGSASGPGAPVPGPSLPVTSLRSRVSVFPSPYDVPAVVVPDGVTYVIP